jgi:hypothetical protein
MQDFLGRFPDLCCAAVLSYLRKSFEFWYDHSPEGMSFGCGRTFIGFLDGSADFRVGNSVTIVASFLKCKARVPVCPSSAESCEIPCEPIVFSHFDFEVFRKAFRATEAKAAHFDMIVVTEKAPRFAPYQLDFFPAAVAKPNRNRHCLIAIDNLEDFVVDSDPIFEQAIQKSITLDSVEFDTYKIKRSIAECQLRLRDMEDFLYIKLDLKRTRHFQKSICRARDYCFARYCHKFVPTLAWESHGIEGTVRHLLVNSPEIDCLTGPLLAELVNAVTVPDPPSSLDRRFAKLRKSYMEKAWGELLAHPGVRYVIELVPEVTRRQHTQFGNVFVLFTHIFAEVREICEYFGCQQESAKVVKFLALNSDFKEILKVFLFFDPLVFQAEFLTHHLGTKRVADWNAFCNVMRATIQQDPDLVREVSDYKEKQSRNRKM